MSVLTISFLYLGSIVRFITIYIDSKENLMLYYMGEIVVLNSILII